MEFNGSTLFAGLVFGAFGVSFFRLGKKRGEVPLLLTGLALIVFPYFISNLYLLWGIGAILLLFGWKKIS